VSKKEGSAVGLLMAAQIIGPIGLIAFAAAGMAPAWAAWTAGAFAVGSFVDPTGLVAPPSIVTGIGALVWSAVLVVVLLVG